MSEVNFGLLPPSAEMPATAEAIALLILRTDLPPQGGIVTPEQIADHARIARAMGQVYYALQDREGVVAAACVDHSGDEDQKTVHIMQLAVHPERQGQGLGRRMLQELARLARAAGETRLLANAVGGQEDFYRHLGFWLGTDDADESLWITTPETLLFGQEE
jgi:predicted N-acetyltransferase YhbS